MESNPRSVIHDNRNLGAASRRCFCWSKGSGAQGRRRMDQLRRPQARYPTRKVVLIDFWAFDCPFCAEAMPHVKEMYDKYAKDGLVVIGVHVPRIDYEKEIPKIKDAVTKKGIKYPVVIDNTYQIWSDYLCNTWPSHFVVDQNGVIQLSHSGTGRYEDTEKVIQKLLAKK